MPISSNTRFRVLIQRCPYGILSAADNRNNGASKPHHWRLRRSRQHPLVVGDYHRAFFRGLLSAFMHRTYASAVPKETAQDEGIGCFEGQINARRSESSIAGDKHLATCSQRRLV